MHKTDSLALTDMANLLIHIIYLKEYNWSPKI